MKTLLTISLGVALLTTTASCEKSNSVKDTYTARVERLKERASILQEFKNASKDQYAERVKRGDTLSLPHEELQKLLPTTIDGYTAANSTGRLLKMSNLPYSVASREFQKNATTVKIELVDYNGIYPLSEGMISILAMLPQGETKQQLIKASALENDDILGLEILQKKEGAAKISLAVGGRFLVNVTAAKQTDLTLVESVAEQINFAKLTDM